MAGFAFDDERIAAVPQLKAPAATIADVFFGRPSQQLQMVASTGTNGKTSTAWWTAQALSRAAAGAAAVIGTLGVGEPPQGDCSKSWRG